MRYTIAATMATTLAAGLLMTTPATAAESSQAATVHPASEAADVQRKSRKCSTPKGRRFNISWSPGMSSTTFYFNNNCRNTQYIKVWATDSATHRTFCKNVKVKPGVKGKKKIWGVIKGNIDMVTFGRCPW